MRKIRVVLVDDHALVRAGWRSLLASEDDIDVVAEAGNGAQGLSLAVDMAPDVVVLDVAMSVLNGIDACREIRRRCESTKVVMLSMHGERRFVLEAFAAGASGYVVKDSQLEEMVAAIRRAHQGSTYACAEISGVLVEHIAGGIQASPGSVPGHFHLTPRQRQVLQLVAEGLNSLEIADELGISGKTVDAHRRRVMEVLGLYSVAELTHYALREGMTTLK